LIYLGFAINDGDDEVDELIFFPGQLNQILNIDKIEVSTNEPSKMVSDCSIT
jgi:hypothetical protein